MSFNYQLLPARNVTGTARASNWYAGFNPSVYRFSYIPDVYAPADIASFALITGTKLWLLTVNTLVNDYLIGDTIIYNTAGGAYYGSVTAITFTGTQVLLTISFSFGNTLPAGFTSYARGVRANTYVLFEFINPITGVAFNSAELVPKQDGTLDLNFSDYLRGFYSNDKSYDWLTVNYLNPESQYGFFLQYTEMPGNVAIVVPETLYTVSAGNKTRSPESSNLVNYLPDDVTPGIIMNEWVRQGAAIPFFPGGLNFINFLFPEDVATLAFSEFSGVVTLDDTQRPGVNYLRFLDSYLGSTTVGDEVCFEIYGEMVPENRKEISFNFRAGVLDEIIYQLTEPLENAEVVTIFGTSLASCGFWYGATVGTLVLYPSFAAWKVAVATASAGEYIKVTNNQTDVSGDNALIIGYTNASPLLSPFTVALRFNLTQVGLDLLLPFKNKIVLNAGAAGLWAGIRTSDATVDDFGAFDYDLSSGAGLAAANAALAGLTEGQSFILHLRSTDHLLKSIQASYLTASRERVMHLSEDTDYKYRTALTGNGTSYDGATQYTYINAGGFPQNKVDRGSQYTALFTFYADTAAAPYNDLFSTRQFLVGGQYPGWELFQFGAFLYLQLYQAPGQQAVFQIAIPIIQGYNIVVLEFDGDVPNLRTWVNKWKAPPVLTTNTLPAMWSIQNGQNDAGIAIYGATSAPAFHWPGDVKKIQFLDGLYSSDIIERAINSGTFEGIVPDANFFFDADMSVSPPAARAGTPAFVATNVGAPPLVTFLP